MPTDTLTLDGQSLTISDVVRAARDSACRVGVAPAAVAALVWLMLDSGAFNPERAPAVTSASLGGLGLLFGLGGWAVRAGGQPERFVAAPSEQLVGMLRDRFEVSARQLEAAIASLDIPDPLPAVEPIPW